MFTKATAATKKSVYHDNDEIPVASTVTFNALPGSNVIERAFYDGNLSVWWLTGAVLGLWFTFAKGFMMLLGVVQVLPGVGFWFGTHLVSVLSITCICIWNIFHSPSHGALYRRLHIVLGRTAIITGFIGVLSGYFTAWSERYQQDNWAFAIGISIGGILQLVFQVLGWYYIRRQNQDVKAHIKCMFAVFFLGCLAPMWMRFPTMVFGVAAPTWWTFGSAGISVVVYCLATRAQLRKRWI